MTYGGFSPYRSFGRSLRPDHSAAFAQLRELGAVKAVAYFSGGNDEGGVDDISVFGANDEVIPFEAQSWIPDPDPEKASKGYGTSESTPLYEDADEIVRGEYGSFAGEFEVSGSVVYDVTAGTVKMSKSERVWQDYGDSSYDV